VKIGFKFQSLGKISNISTSDTPVLLGQFQLWIKIKPHIAHIIFKDKTNIRLFVHILLRQSSQTQNTEISNNALIHDKYCRLQLKCPRKHNNASPVNRLSTSLLCSVEDAQTPRAASLTSDDLDAKLVLGVRAKVEQFHGQRRGVDEALLAGQFGVVSHDVEPGVVNSLAATW